MTYEQFKNQVTGKRAEVLGIGVSNLPLIDFLLECGMTVRARDKKSASLAHSFIIIPNFFRSVNG